MERVAAHQIFDYHAKCALPLYLMSSLLKAFLCYLFESPQFLWSFFLLGWVMTMPVKLYFDCQCQRCLIDYLTPSAARTKVLKCAEDFRCLWRYICSDTCWGKLLMSSRLCWGKLPPAAVLQGWKFVLIPSKQSSVPLKTDKWAQTFVLF